MITNVIPFLLLLTLGFNGAIYLVLGGLLTEYGYDGFVSAALHAGGSAVSMIVACSFTRSALRCSRITIKYYAICSVLGLIGPAVFTFWVIPHIGAGLMAAVIATSPLFTAIFSHFAKVEKINTSLCLGVMTGFVGATIIVLGEASWPTREYKYVWLIASLLVPILLALGNVARTALWPDELSPVQTGAGVSSIGLILACLLIPVFEPGALAAVPASNAILLMIAFFLLNGINAFPFFYLQRIGGPTILSLLSHVMAGFGLLLGWWFLEETYRPVDLLGVALILIGVSATTFIKLSRQQPRSERRNWHNFAKMGESHD